jgi:hypothetical protein
MLKKQQGHFGPRLPFETKDQMRSLPGDHCRMGTCMGTQLLVIQETQCAIAMVFILSCVNKVTTSLPLQHGAIVAVIGAAFQHDLQP